MDAFPIFYSFPILKSLNIFLSALTVPNLLNTFYSKLNSDIYCIHRCYLTGCVHHQLSQSNSLTLTSSWYQFSLPQSTSCGALILNKQLEEHVSSKERIKILSGEGIKVQALRLPPEILACPLRQSPPPITRGKITAFIGKLFEKSFQCRAAQMNLLQNGTVQYPHCPTPIYQPHVANRQLKRGWYNEETEFLVQFHLI